MCLGGSVLAYLTGRVIDFYQIGSFGSSGGLYTGPDGCLHRRIGLSWRSLRGFGLIIDSLGRRILGSGDIVHHGTLPIYGGCRLAQLLLITLVVKLYHFIGVF